MNKGPVELNDLQLQITELKEKNMHLLAAHAEQLRILTSLGVIDRIIIKAADPNGMLDKVLQEFLKIFSCDRAWLLYPCDPNAITYRVPMERTQPQWPGAEVEGIDIPSDKSSRGTFKLVINSPGAVRFDPEENPIDPSSDVNIKFHIRSQLMMAIHPNVGEPWLLGIHHCAAPVIYHQADCDLFEILGRRLADGLSNLLSWQNAKRLFENAEVSIWNEDLSNVYNTLETLRHDGVKDLRQHLADNPHIAWDIAASVKVMHVNEATLNLFGAETEDDFIYAIDKTFGPNSIDVFIAELCAIWNKQKIFRMETTFRSLNGKDINAIISFRIPQTEDGFRSVPVSIINISGRKLVEAQLRKAHDELEIRVEERTRELHKLTQTVEQNPNMIFITDIVGVIEYANEKFYEITGYNPEEVLGQTPRIIKADNTPRSCYEELWRTIKAGKVWHGEMEDRCKDGSTFWADITIAPIRSQDGVVTHYFSSHGNIALRKKAERELQTAKDQADVANRAKSDLIANMSHELRTPLNAIIGFSETMRVQTFGPVGHDKYREYLDDIHYSGHHLLELINDILDISAIEAGAVELHEENVSLADVVEASVRIIAPRADLGQVSISFVIGPTPPFIYADERRLKQILLNLLSNAVKFTPEGGKVSVKLKSSADGALAITVSDNGIGMNEEEVVKALSTFGQVDSGLDRMHEGSGLGLPLTKGLMELHGGTLDVKSEKGHGTMITVTFPKERVRQSID